MSPPKWFSNGNLQTDIYIQWQAFYCLHTLYFFSSSCYSQWPFLVRKNASVSFYILEFWVCLWEHMTGTSQDAPVRPGLHHQCPDQPNLWSQHTVYFITSAIILTAHNIQQNDLFSYTVYIYCMYMRIKTYTRWQCNPQYHKKY